MSKKRIVVIFAIFLAIGISLVFLILRNKKISNDFIDFDGGDFVFKFEPTWVSSQYNGRRLGQDLYYRKNGQDFLVVQDVLSKVENIDLDDHLVYFLTWNDLYENNPYFPYKFNSPYVFFFIKSFKSNDYQMVAFNKEKRAFFTLPTVMNNSYSVSPDYKYIVIKSNDFKKPSVTGWSDVAPVENSKSEAKSNQFIDIIDSQTLKLVARYKSPLGHHIFLHKWLSNQAFEVRLLDKSKFDNINNYKYVTVNFFSSDEKEQIRLATSTKYILDSGGLFLKQNDLFYPVINEIYTDQDTYLEDFSGSSLLFLVSTQSFGLGEVLDVLSKKTLESVKDKLPSSLLNAFGDDWNPKEFLVSPNRKVLASTVYNPQDWTNVMALEFVDLVNLKVVKRVELGSANVYQSNSSPTCFPESECAGGYEWGFFKETKWLNDNEFALAVKDLQGKIKTTIYKIR